MMDCYEKAFHHIMAGGMEHLKPELWDAQRNCIRSDWKERTSFCSSGEAAMCRIAVALFTGDRGIADFSDLRGLDVWNQRKVFEALALWLS